MTNPDQKDIARQLAKILATDPFTRSRRLSSFLQYIVEAFLKNYRNRIKAYSIAVEVLGRPINFDPQTDNIVRVYGSKLRKELKRYYLTEGKEDPIIISVPKGGYFPVIHPRDRMFSTNGLPKASNNGTFLKQIFDSDPCVAVVMFEHLNKEEGAGYLATGLTHEILIALTKFSPLQVKGPIASDEGPDMDISQVLHKYNARFVLQGWIHYHLPEIKISITLSDASNCSKIWAKSFKYNLVEVSLYEIEDEVASKVAAVIGDGLGVVFRKLQSETYDHHIRFNDLTQAVLNYNHAWETQHPADWEGAIITIDEALEDHPNNALLLALFANSCYADVLYELNVVPDAISKMQTFAQRAVSLDPTLQIACYNLVPQHAFFGRAKACVEEAYKVWELNPNHARILSGCAVATVSVGAYGTGRDFIEQAKLLNPHYPGWYHFIDYMIHFAHKKYEKAWSFAQMIHVEGLYLHPLFRAATLGKLGRKKEAQPYLHELLRLKPAFASRYQEYLRPLFVTPRHVDMIWDGLRKAGIEES